MVGSGMDLTLEGRALIKTVKCIDERAGDDDALKFYTPFKALHEAICELIMHVAEQECIDPEKFIGNEINISIKFLSYEDTEAGAKAQQEKQKCDHCCKCHKEDED